MDAHHLDRQLRELGAADREFHRKPNVFPVKTQMKLANVANWDCEGLDGEVGLLAPYIVMMHVENGHTMAFQPSLFDEGGSHS